MVTWNGLVKRRRLRTGLAPLLRLIRADKEDPRPAAVLGRRVVLVRTVFLAELRIRLDDDIGLRKEPEPHRRRRFRARERGLRIRNQLLTVLEEVLPVGAEPLQEGRHVARAERTLGNGPHLLGEQIDLPQPNLVDLLRALRQRAEIADGA